jgi:methyl-accepting chemotaxis protein
VPSSDAVKRTRKFRSLTATLAIAFLTLSVVVLIIAGSLQIYFSFRAEQEKFNILEKAVALGSLATVSQEEQKMALERLLGIEPDFRQLVLLNEQGQELVRISRLSKLLSEQVMRYDKSELFSKISQKETYVSSVYIDEITSEPMVVIATPVTDIFGDFKGTLMADISLKFMWDLVGGLRIGKNGLAYVVDRQGNLIAFGDISRVLRGENLIRLEEVNEFVKGDALIYKPGADISKGILSTYVIANHAHLVTPDWAVVVELPALEAYESVIYGIGVSMGIIILSAILAIWVGMYLSKRITKPIISLRDAAAEIGKGKLDAKIEIESRDEIGELAAGFNDMAAKLKGLYETLEAKVEERTRELEEAKTSLEIKVTARTKELKEIAERQEETIKKRTKEIQERVGELERFHRLAVGRELKMIELKEEIKKLKEELVKYKPST